MLIELKNITKYYDIADGKLYVLDDVSLGVTEGESVAITGPSGSGKSTLLNIIGSLDRPSSGSVLLEGRDLTELGEKELAIIRNRYIGFVFQFHYLLPQCTALENVIVPTLANSDRSAKVDVESRALHLLDRVGLGDRISYYPGQLSGGERQRVAVVRALINRPKVLLADEPTGSLDHSTADNLVQLLLELNSEEKVTLIMVTHSLELAFRMLRTMDLRDGKLSENKIL